MHTDRRLFIGIAVAAFVGAACTPSGGATSAPTAGAPTTATATTAPSTAATAVPATSATATSAPSLLPSFPAGAGAYALFEPKAGGSVSVQGGAALIANDGKTQVVIAVVSSSADTMAASIQAGTCDDLAPEIVHRLTNVETGASTTDVDVELSSLLATPYAINISVAGSETESSITCGEIQAIPTP